MKHLYLLCFILFSPLVLYSQPTILFPQNGQVLDNNQVQIQWKDTASVFDVEWGTDPLLMSAVSINNITTNYVNLPTLPFNIQYYFRIRRSSGNWTPIYSFFILDVNSLPSLQYWWDAGSGIVLNGNKITNWEDRISNIVAQGLTNASKPEVINTFPNNLPLIRFGGTTGNDNHLLSLNPFLTLNSNNFTIITNYQILSTGPLDYLLAGTQSGLFVGGFLGGYNNIGVFNNSIECKANESPTYKPWAVYSAYRNKFYRNNVALPVAGTSVSGFQIEQIGARPDVPTLSFHGYVGDIMIFDTELNDSIRLLVENYQKWKWLQYPNLGNDTTVCATQYTLSVPQPNVYSHILWSTGEVNVSSITVTQNGTYWVQVTGMGITCTDTIRISGLQQAKNVTPSNDTTLCLGQPFVMKITNPTPTHQYIWNTAAIQDSIVINQPGMYYCLEFIPSFNCFISTDTIYVSNRVNANFAYNNSCEGEATTFIDNSSTSNGYINYWQWDMGDTSTHADTANTFFATYSYPQVGNFTVQLVVKDTNGCADTSMQMITILPKPIVNFTVNKECINDPIQFTNLSTIQSPYNIVGYKWYFGTTTNDSSSFINPKFTYSTSGNYPVTLEATSDNGCKNSFTDTLHINKFVDAAFTIPDDTLCKNISYTLTDESIYFNTQAAQWQWSIHGVNIGNENPQILSFTQSGLHQIRMIVTSTDNCTDSMKTSVFIKNPPVAAFTATPQVSAPPLVSVFNYIGTSDAINLAWNFGDGNTDFGNTVTHSYTNVGLYIATLIATDANGCSDTATRTMNVVIPVFDVMLNDLLCAETNGYVQFAADIQNLSSVTITEMEVEAWVQGAEPALEQWQGELFIGNTLNYSSSYSLLIPPQAKYCCLRIGKVTGMISDSVFNKTLCVPLKNEFTVFTPFPNPTEGAFQMHVITPINDEAVLVISDMQGKTLYEQALQLNSGLHTLSVDASSLSSGVYTITIYYREEQQVVRLLKR